MLMFVAANSLLVQRFAAADEKTVVGTVSSVKDDKGEVKTISLKVDDATTYAVTVDDNGKKLAKELDGKKASVTGEVAEKDGKKTITVKSFKAAEEK
jgi:ribosomal protein S17